MARLTGACLALFAAMVAMTHVAAIRDSYDEGSARLSVSEDQDYEKVKGDEILYIPLKADAIIAYRGDPGSASTRLKLKDFGIEVTFSMRVAAIMAKSKAASTSVQLGWKLAKVDNQPVDTLQDVETKLSSIQNAAKTELSSVAVTFDTLDDVEVLPKGWVKKKMAGKMGYFYTDKNYFQIDFPASFGATTVSQAIVPTVGAGEELEEIAIEVSNDFDLGQFGLNIDNAGSVKAVTKDSVAWKKGIAPPGDGKKWTLKWIGDTRVYTREDIDRVLKEISSQVPPSIGDSLVYTVPVTMTFLTVPSTSTVAVPDAGVVGAGAEAGFQTVKMQLLRGSALMTGGTGGKADYYFSVTGGGMNERAPLTIDSNRKVKHSVNVVLRRSQLVKEDWTLEAVDGKWVYSAEDIFTQLMIIVQSLGPVHSREVQLTFCTISSGCQGKPPQPHFFQDWQFWEKAIMLDETKEVEVEVTTDKGKKKGKVSTVEAAKREISVKLETGGYETLKLPEDVKRLAVLSEKDTPGIKLPQ